MAKTKIADIIIPEVFQPYVTQRTMELSALVQSGIVANSPKFDELASGGGKTVHMPYFEDLAGDDEVLSDSTALTVGKIETDQDVAVILQRGKAWSVNDLAKYLSGADPMKAIAELVAAYWARKMQATLIKTLEGVFGAASMSGNLLDISGEADGSREIKGSTFIDALQKLGDAQGGITGVAMHSAARAVLAKNDLITTVRDSEGRPVLEQFMGKTVICDDGCPTAAGTYRSYLFGPGAIALGNNNKLAEAVETGRDVLAGDDILVNRKHFILHPRGVAYQAVACAGVSPTNAELATQTNWVRVYEAKAIKIVAFDYKLV